MTYKFFQPIRLYKANDPYYYEVDNLPLRQLEENILYVKNLIEGGDSDGGGSPTVLTSKSELDLTKIKQLRPKFIGGRSVQVNAGKFTARINDAYGIGKALADLTLINANSIVYPTLAQVWTETLRDTVWNSFTTSLLASNAYNMNGLEIAYTFHPTTGIGDATPITTTNPDGSVLNFPKYTNLGKYASNWPGFNIFNILAGDSALGSSIPSPKDTVTKGDFYKLQNLHLAFVKRWRSVFRTAIVDFPESQVEIESWDNDDFFYFDDTGNKQSLTSAGTRIDLIVAYAMPIDTSSAHLQNYEDDFTGDSETPAPETITQPVLGVIKGAGLGLQKTTNQAVPGMNIKHDADNIDSVGDGTARILANQSDAEETANYGITTDITGTRIHGSFPSPDDLLNMAPALALSVESDNPLLVGQTVFPIAYVITKKGQTLLTDDDIIDIRPFMRTAELTYNERAGIAGANPPLSLANPAVGSYQLQNVVSRVIEKTKPPPAYKEDGVALYTDYVMGGLAYGVEGTLLTMCETGDINDPFGENTYQTSWTATNTTEYAFDEGSESLTPFDSPKNFLDDSNLKRKEAYLEFLYVNKQTYLKRWLADPNRTFSDKNNKGETYLNLPDGEGGRNIPLWPEWDMPLNSPTNFDNLINGALGNKTIPKITWWMWFEAVTENKRGLAFVPGGVGSNDGHSSNTGYLASFFGFGAKQGADASITMCSKTIKVRLPSWVQDYDILAEYVNCGPLTSFSHQTKARSVGLGSGLSINKGSIVDGYAVFQITSAAQNLGSIKGNENSLPNNSGGLKDKNTGTNLDDKIPPSQNGKEYHFLAYQVALPQFPARWSTTAQSNIGALDDTSINRLVPKFGASFYPTVKFTIIGYRQKTPERNANYSINNGYTLMEANPPTGTQLTLYGLTADNPPRQLSNTPVEILL